MQNYLSFAFNILKLTDRKKDNMVCVKVWGTLSVSSLT
uniref:Uncharacterized protein n=1 Tax=Anguilla anguilla TaxID=7936 RepID=A0A0E9TGG4_ANGAN